MKKYLRIFTVLVCSFFISFSVFAEREINITNGKIDKIPLAINFFDYRSGRDKTIAQNVFGAITSDLANCGVFSALPTGAFIEDKVGIGHRPLFAAWRQINASLLLNGYVKKRGSVLEVGFILWDAILEREVAHDVLELPEAMWRRAAHKIGDIVYESVTGNKGYFDTRVAYVSETPMVGRMQKRIAIMDYDGHNHRYLTDNKYLVLTPRFSPNTDQILYLSYARKVPHVFLKNLKTNQDKLVGHFNKMSFAPRFSPDGKKILMSISKRGNVNIIEYDIKSSTFRYLTHGYALNTSPCYSPNQDTIVFTSDREGGPQIYSMNADGYNVRRLTYGKGAYSTPVFSPDGEFIAFTKQARGKFYVGVMRADGTQERILTSGYLVEGPTWAPSSRMIMFTRGERSRGKVMGINSIYMIDITGHNEILVPTPKGASDPEWSAQLD